jgi:hypothetical protein
MGGVKVDPLPKEGGNGVLSDDMNPNYKHIMLNDEEWNKKQMNLSNYIRTTKYTLLSFPVLSLWY